MIYSINIASLGPADSWETPLGDAATAGLDTVEFNIGPGMLIDYDTPKETCASIAATLQRSGLRTSGLMAHGFESAHFASPTEPDRQLAKERVIAALDRAAWLGADHIAIPPAIASASVNYSDCLTLAVSSLTKLRFDAQRRGVRIACTHAGTNFLLSPLEMRAFIDRINSPFVGNYLDLCAALPAAPSDFVTTLAGRIFAARLPSPGANIDESAIIDGLREIPFQEYLILPTPADASRLRAILSPHT